MNYSKNIRVRENSVNIIELLYYLVSHWIWYLLSVCLFVGYFIYSYNKTAYVYNRAATIMIRTSDNTPETVRMGRLGTVNTRANGTSEVLQLRSKELMRSVVSRINADISYTIREGLREKELYTDAPIIVTFLDAGPKQQFSFDVILKDDQKVDVYGFSFSQEIKNARLNDTIQTSVGNIIITPSANYKQTLKGMSIRVTKFNQEVAVNYFIANMTVIQPESTVPIIKILINDRSAARATDLLYTLINIFNERSIEEKNRVAVNMGKFIQERLSVIEHDLGDVETDLEVLKGKNEGLDINVAAGMYVSDNQSYKSDSKMLENRMWHVGYMKQYLENETRTTGLIPNNPGLESVEIDKQISQYNNAVLKRNKLAEGNSLNNPVILEVDESLKLMRENLLIAVNNLYNSLDKMKERNLRDAHFAQEQIRAIPIKQRELLSIERQQKVKEDLYIFLLNKREENILNGAIADSNARIIDSPSGSDTPISPQRIKMIAMGIGSGLFVPTIILLLLFRFDTRIRSRRDIEGITSVPFLGSIPFHKPSDSAIVFSGQARDVLSEAFRILRINLDFIAGRSSDSKVITCTSFTPGSGKTFVSLNLAVCLSLNRKRVIILDLDLRKATLSHLTKMNKLVGISKYLSDESVNIEDIIQQDILGSTVDIIPVGTIPPNPSELLMSERLDELISDLKDRYDYILIDNVPVGIVADSTIISRVCDVTLFIIRAGKQNKQDLYELEEMSKEAKLKNIVLLINGVKKTARYGYSYGDEAK